MNPIPFIIIGFLLIGLVWSGGHVAWMIALGIFVLLMVVAQTIEVVTAKSKMNKALTNREIRNKAGLR